MGQSFPFCRFKCIKGMGLERQRNDLIREFLNNKKFDNCDYIYLDSDDIIVSQKGFRKFLDTTHKILVMPVMLENNVPNIFKDFRTTVANPMLVPYSSEDKIPANEDFKIKYCGLSGIFHRSIFEDERMQIVPDEKEHYGTKKGFWFRYFYDRIAEDIDFCKRLNENGYEIMCNLNIPNTHLKMHPYQLTDIIKKKIFSDGTEIKLSPNVKEKMDSEGIDFN
jgi:hypothetical protein